MISRNSMRVQFYLAHITSHFFININIAKVPIAKPISSKSTPHRNVYENSFKPCEELIHLQSARLMKYCFCLVSRKISNAFLLNRLAIFCWRTAMSNPFQWRLHNKATVLLWKKEFFFKLFILAVQKVQVPKHLNSLHAFKINYLFDSSFSSV